MAADPEKVVHADGKGHQFAYPPFVPTCRCGLTSHEVEFGISSSIRQFDTGATRDTINNKPQYEGYLSPVVLERYGRYMLKHQQQSDGTQRPSDNWQKGIPPSAYMDSLLRHVMDVWLHHRGYPKLAKESREDAICGALFNLMGYLHEELKDKQSVSTDALFRVAT
jgi:hypothetical protein